MTGATRRPPLLARGDVVAGLALLAFALLAWSAGRGLPFGSLRNPGAGFLPAVLSIALGIFAALIVLRGVIRSGIDLRERWADRAGLARVAAVTAVLAIGLALVDPLGFAPAGGFICCVMARAAGRSWLRSLVFGLSTSFVLWLLFAHWLRVNLPDGWLIIQLLGR